MASKPLQWVFGAAALLLVGAVVAVGQNAMQAEPTAVAVVDVQAVFDALDEKEAIENQLQQRAQQLQQEEKQRRQEIEQMRSDLEVLGSDSEAYQQQQEEVQQKLIEFRSWRQYSKQKMQRLRGLKIESLYQKTADAAGRVAEDNGYDMVLYKASSTDLNYENSEQLSQMLQMRKVLWARDQLDVTDQVIQRMNNEFESGGGSS